MPLYAGRMARRAYSQLPTVAQNAAVSAYGRRLKARYENAAYRERLEALRRSDLAEREELEEMQKSALRVLLCHAYEHVPYWRATMDSIGTHPARDDAHEVLAALPLLDKETVVANSASLRSDLLRLRSARRLSKWVETSGTTGKALRLVVTRDAMQRESAFRDLHRTWSGFEIGGRCAVLMSFPVVPTRQLGPPFWRVNRGQNQLLLSAPHISDANMPSYLNALASYGPELIHGFPSGVYLVALGCLKYGETRIRPTAVYTSQETLLPHQRDAIESAFGCPVFDWYGNTELAGNIVECEHGRRHVQMQHSLVEFLDDEGKPALPGEAGEIVGSAIGNLATPLIRYRTGDVAVLSDENRCPCGRAGQLVREILGRVNDFIVTPDGRHVRVSSDALRHVGSIVEAQIVQSEVDTLEVRIVVRPSFRTEDERLLEESIRAYIGQEMGMTVVRMDAIPRDSSGKFRYVVSKIPVSVGSEVVSQS